MTQCWRMLSTRCGLNDSVASGPVIHFGQLDQRLAEIAKQKNDEIELYLAQCKKSDRKLIKILLLGGPASGKSTFMKQMRIMYKDGYKKSEELQYFSGLITANIYKAFRQLVSACTALSIDTTSIDDLIVELMRRFATYGMKQTCGIRVSRPTAQLLHKFWLSEPIQQVYHERYNFELLDSASYFLNQLERISDPNFIPEELDILYCRMPASAAVTTSFSYGNVNLRISSIGGQSSQCRKWMHMFDDVRVVIFMVDLTTYARKHFADKSKKEMHNVLRRFREVARSNFLWHAFMLLFFNKTDLFDEMLTMKPLSECFPRCSGEKDVMACRECVRSVFIKAAEPRTSIVTHFTIATQTHNIGFAFSSCINMILKHVIRNRTLL